MPGIKKSDRVPLGAALMLALVGASACITTSFQIHLVASRAKFDLDCDKVDVAELGNDTFGARGCGRRASSAPRLLCENGG